MHKRLVQRMTENRRRSMSKVLLLMVSIYIYNTHSGNIDAPMNIAKPMMAKVDVTVVINTEFLYRSDTYAVIIVTNDTLNHQTSKTSSVYKY